MQPTDIPRDERAADDEVERVSAQITGQLAERGVLVHDDDDPAARSDILSAVQRFEVAVQLCGASSYTNAPQSSEPDDERFVVPRRADDESADAYVRRVRDAADRLSPPRPGGGPHPGSAV
jgi:hypothetical protein